MRFFLFGYSIHLNAVDCSWTESRRNRFLIEPNIFLPKSIDPNVWEEQYDVSDLDLYYPWPKWQDKTQLAKFAKYDPMDEKVSMLKIIAHEQYGSNQILTEEGDSIFIGWDAFSEINNVDFSCEEFKYFLGYDIADSGCYSSLSNCGFNSEDVIYCREKYLRYLNIHGLFDDFKIAEQYKTYSNTRVASHAPFFIFALFSDKPLV